MWAKFEILSIVGSSYITAGLPISQTHTKNQFANKPEGLRHFLSPPFESSRREEFRSDWSIILWSFFDLLFCKTSENMPPTKMDQSESDSPR